MLEWLNQSLCFSRHFLSRICLLTPNWMYFEQSESQPATVPSFSCKQTLSTTCGWVKHNIWENSTDNVNAIVLNLLSMGKTLTVGKRRCFVPWKRFFISYFTFVAYRKGSWTRKLPLLQNRPALPRSSCRIQLWYCAFSTTAIISFSYDSGLLLSSVFFSPSL